MLCSNGPLDCARFLANWAATERECELEDSSGRRLRCREPLHRAYGPCLSFRSEDYRSGKRRGGYAETPEGWGNTSPLSVFLHRSSNCPTLPETQRVGFHRCSFRCGAIGHRNRGRTDTKRI